MTEEFLHFIWKYKLFDPHLQLVSGEPLEVINPGMHNTDSGPDFFNARIRVGDTTWAGNIEIHVHASDWLRHNHQADRSYDNVILHVVWRSDASIAGSGGLPVPTLELDGRYNATAWHNYLKFMASPHSIPCGKMAATVEPVIRNSWLDRLLVDRLERKSMVAAHLLALTQNDWIQVFYRMLAGAMGFNINSQAFEMLARSLPYAYLAKHADDLFQVEALVFGQAGLLGSDFADEYPQRLKKEYEFLRKKFSLTPADAHVWKFMRLHPGNFPTVRLAQFAAIIHHSGITLASLFETSSVDDYRKLFTAAASEYWDTHFVFDKTSPAGKKSLGTASADLLIINLVAPLLVAYGRWKSEPGMIEKAVDLLAMVPAESNRYMRQWKEIGIPAENAAMSQALLELRKNHCDLKLCLNCRIGVDLLK